MYHFNNSSICLAINEKRTSSTNKTDFSNNDEQKHSAMLPPAGQTRHRRDASDSSNKQKPINGGGDNTKHEGGRSLPPQPQVAMQPFHKKYPSDEVSHGSRSQVHQPANHRHSYQVGTNSAQNDQKVNVNQFQMKNSGKENVFAVVARGGGNSGPLMVGVTRSNAGIKPAEQPQPKSRHNVETNKSSDSPISEPRGRAQSVEIDSTPYSNHEENRHATLPPRWSPSQDRQQARYLQFA